MAKKGGSFWDNPFGGMFDFNGDGKEDWGEQWLAFKIFEECTKEDKPHPNYSDNYSYHPVTDDDDDIDSSGDSIDTSWRDFCEDGSKYDIDPEDYESEEEYEDALAEAKEKVAWRDTCEDGSDVFIDPEDYDTEDEYNDALQAARTAWRDTCEDGSEYGIDPEDYETEDEYDEALTEAKENVDKLNCDFLDFLNALETDLKDAFGALADDVPEINEGAYPNKRRIEAAYMLINKASANQGLYWDDEENEHKDKARSQFILDNADTIIAANYLISEGRFLYAQAIKDNFELPVSLPDEDEYRMYEFSEALCKIAKRNTALSFEVWEWSLTTFLPYAQYADDSLNELTSFVIDELYGFPENYRTELVLYMDAHPDFLEKIMDQSAEMASDLDTLIFAALQDGLTNTARALFQCGLAQAGSDWKKINNLTKSTISWCENYDELESAECFKLELLPLVKAIDVGMVQDEIDDWEKELDKYISQVEDDCEQYAYTRKNAWRATVPDGSQYGLDPRYFDSEQEYLDALNEEKYGWREWYKDDDTLGLNVNDFEKQEDFQKAYDLRLNENRQREREQRERERLKLREQREKEQKPRRDQEQRMEAEKARDDNKIYTLCGVEFPHALHPYHYRTDDPTIKVGDTVLVPVGNDETTGIVVSIGQYMRIAAPFPVDKTKYIIGKVEDKSE